MSLYNATAAVLNFGVGFIVPTTIAAELQSSYKSIVPGYAVLIVLTGLSTFKFIPLPMQFGFDASASCLVSDWAEQNALRKLDPSKDNRIVKRKIDSCAILGAVCGAVAGIVARILGVPIPGPYGTSILVSLQVTPALISYVTPKAFIPYNNYAADQQLTQ